MSHKMLVSQFMRNILCANFIVFTKSLYNLIFFKMVLPRWRQSYCSQEERGLACKYFLNLCCSKSLFGHAIVLLPWTFATMLQDMQQQATNKTFYLQTLISDGQVSLQVLTACNFLVSSFSVIFQKRNIYIKSLEFFSLHFVCMYHMYVLRSVA